MRIETVVRQFDELSRVVIPKEYFNKLGWEAPLTVELIPDVNGIRVSQAHPEHSEVQKVDAIGRLHIPQTVRSMCDMCENNAVELVLTEGGIVIRSYRESCLLCGNSEQSELVAYAGKYICRACVQKLRKVAEEK